VAIRGRKIDAIQQFFHRESMELRSHLGATAEHALDASLLERDTLAQRFEQLGRREHALDVMRLQNRQRLIDTVTLILLCPRDVALLEQLDHPARIEIDAEADAAAVLAQMLDRQPQPAWATRPKH